MGGVVADGVAPVLKQAQDRGGSVQDLCEEEAVRRGRGVQEVGEVQQLGAVSARCLGVERDEG